MTSQDCGKPRFPARLARQKRRVYENQGNSAKYKKLKKAVKLKEKEEGSKFIEKQVNLAKEKGEGGRRK